MVGGAERMTLVEFLTARLDATERALIEYRDHRERGDHVNYEGAPGEFDPYDSCSRCVGTAKASVYSNVDFGLRDVESNRAIIAEVVSWKHFYLDEDAWYSCGLAEDPHDSTNRTVVYRIGEKVPDMLAYYAEWPD